MASTLFSIRRPTTPTPPRNPKTVTVKSGDTLSAIASRAGLTLSAFLAIPGNTPRSGNVNLIYPGEVFNTGYTTPTPSAPKTQPRDDFGRWPNDPNYGRKTINPTPTPSAPKTPVTQPRDDFGRWPNDPYYGRPTINPRTVNEELGLPMPGDPDFPGNFPGDTRTPAEREAILWPDGRPIADPGGGRSIPDFVKDAIDEIFYPSPDGRVVYNPDTGEFDPAPDKTGGGPSIPGALSVGVPDLSGLGDYLKGILGGIGGATSRIPDAASGVGGAVGDVFGGITSGLSGPLFLLIILAGLALVIIGIMR